MSSSLFGEVEPLLNLARKAVRQSLLRERGSLVSEVFNTGTPLFAVVTLHDASKWPELPAVAFDAAAYPEFDAKDPDNDIQNPDPPQVMVDRAESNEAENSFDNHEDLLFDVCCQFMSKVDFGNNQ
jgi:hypothetical protein